MTKLKKLNQKIIQKESLS